MFNDWLLSKLKEKEWSQADLSRASGLTTAAISKYINGRIPDTKALKKIARAFRLPNEKIFEVAGVLPQQNPITEVIQEITHLTKELPQQEQQDILEFIKMRHRLAEKRGKNETKRTRNKPAIS